MPLKYKALLLQWIRKNSMPKKADHSGLAVVQHTIQTVNIVQQIKPTTAPVVVDVPQHSQIVLAFVRMVRALAAKQVSLHKPVQQLLAGVMAVVAVVQTRMPPTPVTRTSAPLLIAAKK